MASSGGEAALPGRSALQFILYDAFVRRLAGSLLWLLILLTAGLPLAWIVLAMIAHGDVAWAHLAPDSYQLRIFGRTLALAAAGAVLATLFAIPPAAVLARWRWSGLALWPIMAALLVVPEPAWAYAWAELVRQAFGASPPRSLADLARVAMTNGAAWWPIPAAAIALAWRRLPASILDTATLDGARGRITIRLLAGPAFAGWAIVMLLSAQNLAAPDQNGIVVASVIVRDTFQSTTESVAGETVLADQSARLAAAIAVGFLSFLATALLAMIGWRVFARSIDWSREEESFDAPQSRLATRAWSGELRNRPTWLALRAGFHRASSSAAFLWVIAALVLLVLTLLLPILALLRTNDGLNLTAAFEAHGQSLGWGIILAASAAGVCAAAALLATLARPRGQMILSLACFLLGGQLLALGMIRVYLPPADSPQLWARALGELYDTGPFYTAAYVALFAWLPLAVAGATWTGRWRGLRDLAAADGASATQTAAYVVWPLAWPGFLAISLAVLALSLTESHAAALLVPGTPINFMLSNVHTLNYSAMAEAALFMMVVCGGATAIVVAAWLVTVKTKDTRNEIRVTRSLRRRVASLVLFSFLVSLLSLLCAACDRPPAPEAVWSESGAAAGQLAYPRAIAYSPADDTVWVVDKAGRIQQFDSEGNYLNGWTTPEQKFGKPVGVSVDREGNVWVPDTHYFRVIVYRPDGSEWFRFGERGDGPGMFIWPTDVLVLDDGRVLVSEYGSGGGDSPSSDRIQIFQRNSDGTITDAPRQVIGQIGSFGTGPGQFRRPQSIVMRGDVLWVTDGTNHRLLAFDLEGNLLKTLGEGAGSGPGEFRFPYGLDVDAEGNLLVSEFGNHRVQKIDPDTGEALAIWGGSFGARPGQAKYPWGLAYDTQRDRVILLDSGNDRMQVVRLESQGK